MSKIDLSSYETVKQRKKRFYGIFSDGRIEVELLNSDITDQALVRARVFVSSDDQKNNLPRGIGYAHELRDKELKTSAYGKQYESVNYTSWIENCEESAVGRALDNAGFFSEAKCSQQEMIQVDKKKSNSAYTNLNSGVYIVPFGQYKGKRLEEVPPVELKEYLDFVITSARGKNKKLQGEVLDFTLQADKYLIKLEDANPPQPQIKLESVEKITTRDIPF